MPNLQQIILASQSPTRLKLLTHAGIDIATTYAPDIDESPLPKELPRILALRLAKAKAQAAIAPLAARYPDAFIIAADTVVAKGRRVLDKALTDAEVAAHLKLLSGGRCHVYTGVAVVRVTNGESGTIASCLNHSQLKCKILSASEIAAYVASRQGIGIAGGCNIDGAGEALFPWIQGSYSGIRGLPLYETLNLLYGLGYRK